MSETSRKVENSQGTFKSIVFMKISVKKYQKNTSFGQGCILYNLMSQIAYYVRTEPKILVWAGAKLSNP